MKIDRADLIILAVVVLTVICGITAVVVGTSRPPSPPTQLKYVGGSEHEAVDVYHDDGRGVTCYVARAGVSCFLDDAMFNEHAHAVWMRENTGSK
jgi:hypothetical protein